MVDNQFNCPACGGNFQSKQALDEHAKNMHSAKTSEEEHSISCLKCGLKADASNKMAAHSCATC